MRRVKVICTLGPATDTEEQIRSLVDAGMDVARFNLSHGSYAEHERRYAHVRRASDHSSRAVGVLVDHGRLNLEVIGVTETDVVTRVLEGGPVSNNKGLNLPGVAVSVPALSEKDVEDLRWALHLRADLIALSFVRSARDVARVHEV